MPANPQDSTRADHSFTRCEPKAWRWAVSWPRNPNWVQTRENTTASASCHQESPRATIATQTPAKAATVRAIETT